MEEVLQNELTRLQRGLILGHHESQHPPNYYRGNRHSEKHAIRGAGGTYLVIGDRTFLNLLNVIFSVDSLNLLIYLCLVYLSIMELSKRYFGTV